MSAKVWNLNTIYNNSLSSLFFLFIGSMNDFPTVHNIVFLKILINMPCQLYSGAVVGTHSKRVFVLRLNFSPPSVWHLCFSFAWMGLCQACRCYLVIHIDFSCKFYNALWLILFVSVLAPPWITTLLWRSFCTCLVLGAMQLGQL